MVLTGRLTDEERRLLMFGHSPLARQRRQIRRSGLCVLGASTAGKNARVTVQLPEILRSTGIMAVPPTEPLCAMPIVFAMMNLDETPGCNHNAVKLDSASDSR